MTKTTIRQYMTPSPHTIGAEQMLTVASLWTGHEPD